MTSKDIEVRNLLTVLADKVCNKQSNNHISLEIFVLFIDFKKIQGDTMLGRPESPRSWKRAVWVKAYEL